MAFILISEAVKMTGLDRQTIRNWMDKGIIPHQKINGTFYVDGDTFEALAEPMRDLDRAIKSLEAEKEKYLKQKDDYFRMYEEARNGHNVKRFLSICVNSGLRTRFFDSIIQIMRNESTLSEREAQVLSEVLNGTDLSDIAESRHCKRNNILYIAEKAVRKSRDLIIPHPKEDKEKDEEIKSLKEEIVVLKRMLYRDAVRVAEDGLTDTEKRLARMDKLELIKLLSKQLDKEGLSVRALNTLSTYSYDGVHRGVRTLGDLCRVSQRRFMQHNQVGKRVIEELTDYLTANGLTWGMDIDRILGLF